MEEPIRKEDIIDIQGTQDSINELIKTLENLSSIMRKDLKEAADELQKSLQGVNVATKEGQERVKNASSQAEVLAATQKEQNKLDQERIRLQARLSSLNSNEAQEIQKLKVAIENKNKSMKEAARLDDSAEGSVNKMRSRLKELTAEYNKLSASARKDASPAIKKLTDELKKAESAIGNNTRNVGNYGSALSSLPGPLGMAVTGVQRLITASKAFIATPIGAVIAAVATAIGTLTAWFKRSEEGQNALNTAVKTFGVVLNNILDIAGDVGEALFGVFKNIKSIFTGEKSLKEALHDTGQGFKQVGTNVKNLVRETKEELKVARELAELENSNIKRTREWGVEKAKIDAQIAALREDAEKRDEATAQERIKLIDQALALEEKVYQQEKKLAEERLKIQRGFNAMSDSNREDKQKEADLEIALINLQTQRDLMQRTMEAKRQSLLREAQTELKSLKEKNQLEQVEFDRQINDQRIGELRRYTGMTREEIQKRADIELQIIEDAERRKREMQSESFGAISNSLNTLSALYEENKQRELSAAGDNAEKRAEIEKKYSQRQQTLAIGQALINAAMAITEIWRKYATRPIYAGILTALNAAQMAAQIAIIKGQKFAKGGSGVLNGPSHQRGGINVGIGEAEGGEHIAITSRRMTSKYGPKMLDAVSKSINQGKFFEVWANVNREMTNDPYTKKMYELMMKTPSIYPDSDGNTVKEYPDGKKYIIKKFYRN